MEKSENYLLKKVIVIGAGISGLACASQLRDYGFQNVIVLEAKDHIGGRTCTANYKTASKNDDEESDSAFIELGAQWIHGQNENVIYELAHSKGLVDESAFDYYEALTNFKFNYDGKQLEAVQDLIKYLDDEPDEIPEDVNLKTSIADYLDEKFNNYIFQITEPELIELLNNAYDWYQKVACELSGCVNLSSVSYGLMNEYKDCEGLQTVELKYGYSSIVNLLCEKIPANTIVLNSVVERIDWSNFTNKQNEENASDEPICKCGEKEFNLKVKVSCDNGEIYEADHVIITIPLGHLKENIDKLFIPALSQKKKRAIESVGFGTVNKIFLEFSDPFWEPPTIYHVIWNSSLDEIFECNKNSRKWVYYINRFAYTPSHHNMLCAWVVGEGAVTMEKMSEEEISSDCMKLLELIVGRLLPKPVKIVRTAWHSDPYTRGSYSYLSLESEKRSNLDIAEPEFTNVFNAKHPVLQFAGEASNPVHYSTVHGAYETGLREAQQLFDHYRYS